MVKKPVDSLENFYINSFGRKLYSMFFEGYTEKLWGRHPREIAPDWGAQRHTGNQILNRHGGDKYIAFYGYFLAVTYG